MSLSTKQNFAFIDVETTGLYSDIHEVIEIGCIIVERGENGPADLKVIEELDIKVKPDHIERADPGSLRVNGYDASDWLFAHTQKQAFELLAKKTQGCVFVAHNVAFDWNFIDASFRRLGIEHGFSYHKLDTLSMAFLKFNGTDEIKHLSLRALCEHYKIINEKAHSALPDVRATIEIYKRLVSK